MAISSLTPSLTSELKNSRPGHIYFVKLPLISARPKLKNFTLKHNFFEESHLYKVGYTRNILTRLSHFQLKYSLEAEMLRLSFVYSPLIVESSVHYMLHHWRIRPAEFYIPSQDLSQALEFFDIITKQFIITL